MVHGFTKGNIRIDSIGNMDDLKSWKGPALVAVLVVAAGYVVAYPLNPNDASLQGIVSTTKYTVNLATNIKIGPYLANSTGFTLYLYAKDSANGTSACNGRCVTFWPLFYLGNNLTLPPGLSASRFGLATRSDGREQSTFDGHPLYFFVKDKAPGQINGQNANHFYACCSIVNHSSTSGPPA